MTDLNERLIQGQKSPDSKRRGEGAPGRRRGNLPEAKLLEFAELLFFAYREVAYTNDLWWQFEFDGNLRTEFSQPGDLDWAPGDTAVTTLAAASAVGATNIKVVSVAGMSAGIERRMRS